MEPKKIENKENYKNDLIYNFKNWSKKDIIKDNNIALSSCGGGCSSCGCGSCGCGH